MTLDARDQALAHRDRAEQALAGCRLDAAYRHAAEAARLDPDNPDTRMLQARTALRLHRPRAAMSAMDARDRIVPDRREHRDILRLRIEALVMMGRTDLALRAAETLAEHFPEDAGAHRAVAELSESAGGSDAAIHALRIAADLAPWDQAIARRLAELLDTAGRADEALDVLAYQDNAPTRRRRAHLAGGADRLADASAEYTELLRSAGDDQALLIDAADLDNRLGATGPARRRLRHAAALPGPKRAGALEALAVTHMRRGAFTDAGYTWWKLTRLTPDAPRAWAGLALCALIEERDGLLHRAERELSLHTSRAERRAVMAELWPNAAIAMAKPRHAADPAHHTKSPLTNLLRTSSHALGRAARQHPERADLFYHLAVCEHQQGDTTLARQAVERALAINPHYAAAQALAMRADGDKRAKRQAA